jgi:hypothetical protein
MVAENDNPAYDCRLEAVDSLVVIEKVKLLCIKYQ